MKPAARLTDMTVHGGVITSPGAARTMIEMLPAARVTDMHTCPMQTPGTPPIPHVGGPIIMGSFTVFIEFLPAARIMDQCICVGPPDQIAKGAMKTLIGDGGGGGGGAMVTMPQAPGMDMPGVPAIPSPDAPAASAGVSNGSADIQQCTTEGDPVDVATGRMVFFTEDFALTGSPAFTFRRFYSSSNSPERSLMGFGWNCSLSERIEIHEEALVYINWQGRRILFPHIALDETIHHLDEHIALSRTLEFYELLLPDGNTLHFERPPGIPIARLKEIRDASYRVLRLDYRGNMARCLTDTFGNQYLFESLDGISLHAIKFRAENATTETYLARYDYDSNGNLTAATDAVGQTARYYYDQNHRLIQKVDRNGYAFFFQYDTLNRCTRTWGQDGLFDQTFVYTVEGEEAVTIVRDSQNRETRYYYNMLGLVTRSVDAAGNMQTFEYAGTAMTKHTDALERSAEFQYDKFGRVTGYKSPAGCESKAEYGPDGSAVLTDGEGNIVLRQRSDDSLTIALPDAPAPLEQLTMDRRERTISVDDGAGNLTKYVYDQADRVIEIIYPMGQKYRYQYDARGNQTAVIDPTGAVIRFVYDAMGRVLGVQREGGSAFQFHYHGEGELSHFVDGNGRTARYEYEGFDRLSAVVNPLGQRVRYQYDNANHLRKIVDARSAEIVFDYDDLGRLQRILYPDGFSEVFEYDRAGQLRRMTDRSGLVNEFVYDPDGRVTSIQYADGRLEFAYDKNGRLVRASGGNSTVAYAYDGYGRIVREEQDGIGVAYVYGDNGQLARLELPGGEQIVYEYDPNGNLATLTDWDGRRHLFEHTDTGEIKTHRFPNGMIARYTYNRLGLPVQVGVGRERDPRPTALCAYRYDGNDNLTEIADNGLGRVQYRYDGAGRLIESQHDDPDRSEQFDYDASGNLTTIAGASGFSYDYFNRLQGGPGVRCQSDARGNVTLLEVEGQGTLRLTYNARNQLARANLPDGSVAEYAYDPFGRRILKKHRGAETRYFWVGDTMVHEETTGAIEEMRDYLYLPGEVPTPLAIRVNGTTFCVHADHRGAPTRVTNGQGNLVWLADYSGYGQARIRVNDLPHALRFPGQYFDAETGLHYNRARYYSPAVGRYLSVDPKEFAEGVHFFAYADNDPVNLSDPLGMAVGSQKKRKPQGPPPPTRNKVKTGKPNPAAMTPQQQQQVVKEAKQSGKQTVGKKGCTGDFPKGTDVSNVSDIGKKHDPDQLIRDVGTNRQSAEIKMPEETFDQTGMEDQKTLLDEGQQDFKSIDKRAKEKAAKGEIPSTPEAIANFKAAERKKAGEKVAQAGAEAYARQMGYTPVLEWNNSSERPQGFDAVYEDAHGNLVVIEAKSNNSPRHANASGVVQGTIPWVTEVASKIWPDCTQGKGSSNARECETAGKILQAIPQKKVRIETVRVIHDQGKLDRAKVACVDGALP
jgi:RHS repeat-associated protein